MQPYCFLCKKRCEIGVKCLHVPSNELKRKLWNESAGVEFTPHSRICENHFKRGDFYENATKRRRLREGALPKQIEVKSFCYTEHIKVEFNTNKKDFSSQTEKEVVEAGIALENLRLQIKVKSLVTEVALLKQQLEEANLLNASISKLFSATQLQHLRTGGQCHWKQDDISSSICLHAAGPRAYRQLYKKGFPLPHVSTLQKRSSKTKTKNCRQKKGSTSQKRSSKTKNCRQKKENSK